MPTLHAPSDLLQHLRSLMPGVAGVVLATEGGRALAHDAPCDAHALAGEGWRRRNPSAPTSGTLVPAGTLVYLVLFLPESVWSRWTEPPKPFPERAVSRAHGPSRR